MSKRALITGILGQDGSYLAELLLSKGYQVFGMVRRTTQPHHENIRAIHEKISLIPGDLIDITSLVHVLERSQPDEIYNLAAQSHVGLSFSHPQLTAQVNGLGVQRLLEALRLVGLSQSRFYQASTSEMYGNNGHRMQHEYTPFMPVSPYATAKVFAHHTVRNYREMGMWACSGILFNHESPRRSLDFVTRKISDGVARIALGLIHTIELGNLEAQRDWGYAPEYVEAMWRMLQGEQPRDYVIATGEMHSVADFVQEAFSIVGLEPHAHIVHSAQYSRSVDVQQLCGDSLIAQSELEWAPTVRFYGLVKRMVEADMLRLQGETHGVCV